MSENELVKVDELDDLVPQKYAEEDLDAAASTQAYLPRLQLMTSGSGKCKSGEFPINHYALITDQKFDDLGKNVDVFLFAVRPKALETGDAIISCYDPSDAEFQRIKKKSDEVKNSGCMYGIEFLAWVPSVKKLATFFMGTKSARRESGAARALLKQSATLGSQFCKNKTHEWYAPQVSECSTPFEMPERDVLVAAVEKFNNPPKSDIEGVEESEEERAR